MHPALSALPTPIRCFWIFVPFRPLNLQALGFRWARILTWVHNMLELPLLDSQVKKVILSLHLVDSKVNILFYFIIPCSLDHIALSGITLQNNKIYGLLCIKGSPFGRLCSLSRVSFIPSHISVDHLTYPTPSALLAPHHLALSPSPCPFHLTMRSPSTPSSSYRIPQSTPSGHDAQIDSWEADIHRKAFSEGREIACNGVALGLWYNFDSGSVWNPNIRNW